MTQEKINEIVAAAVGKSFDAWAAEHPSLAAVIDRIRLTEQTVESLRDSDAYRQVVGDLDKAIETYRQAIAGYHRDRSDLNLLTQLADLAGPILTGILGL